MADKNVCPTVSPHYRLAIVPSVRNDLEKAAGRGARSGANGVNLPAGENLALFYGFAVIALLIATYGEDFDIDAILAIDIIPRGCEVRQAWQSR
jgi:hypothetical protein